MPDMQAMAAAMAIMQHGKISKTAHGDQYCFHSVTTSGVEISVTKQKSGTETFFIRMANAKLWHRHHSHPKTMTKKKTPTKPNRPAKQETGGGCPGVTCCASSIPALLPNGKGNPEYRKWYRAKRKAEGRPLGGAEYFREYRKTIKGKSIVKKWNDSEEGKIARKRCRIRKMAKRRPGESDSEYQARFDRCLELMDSLHNNAILKPHEN